MIEKKLLCPFCKKNGKQIELEIESGIASCPDCNSSIMFEAPEYINLKNLSKIWEKNADDAFHLIKILEPQYIEDPSISSLYEDIYQTLLIGRYRASIVLMGTFIEAIVKERIRLKTGKDFQKPLGPALKELKNQKLMENYDIQYLELFKNEIRNSYLHIDDKLILEDQYLMHFPIEYKNGHPDPTKLMKLVDDAVSGKVQPVPIRADAQGIRFIANEIKSKKYAIYLLNDLTDFLISASVKYFNVKEYEEFEKRFGSGFEGFNHYNDI